MASKILCVAAAPLLLLGLLAVSQTATGQENDILSRIYGSGVHAYHNRDYTQAHAKFSTAIDGGSMDPRAYYFRGLTYQKLGRAEQAQRDFARAADLELRDGDLADVVSRALTRVQGPGRHALETVREGAQQKMLRQHRAMNQDRFTPSGSERRIPDPTPEPVEAARSEPAAGDTGQADEGTENKAEQPSSDKTETSDRDSEDLFDIDSDSEKEEGTKKEDKDGTQKEDREETEDPFSDIFEEQESGDEKQPQEDSDEDPFG
jgi:tetratricopeptide (TPR) repeat protein